MIVEKKFYVGFRMVDEALKIKSGELLNLFTDIAGIHSESVGYKFGEGDVRWLLVGYSVKFFDKPKYSQEITLRTWSRDYTPAFAIREFEVLSDTGVVLAIAMCHFVRYNIALMKLEKITDDGMAGYVTENDRSNFDFKKLKRLVEPTNFDGEIAFEVDWRWIDLNRHLNNSHYVDLAERVILDAYGVDVSGFDFDVTYKAQIKEGEKIRCKYSKTDEGYTVIYKSMDDKVLHGGVTFFREEITK